MIITGWEKGPRTKVLKSVEEANLANIFVKLRKK